MVTSVPLHNAVWMDGVQVNANDLRLQAVAGMLTGAAPSGTTGIATRPGIRYGPGNPFLISASSGMSVTVGAGVGFVQGSTSATAGMYTACLDTTSTMTVTTSDPTNPRIDNVIIQFVDVGSSSSTATVNIQAGTPAVSPVAPTLPANSLLLALVAVGAGVSSITSGNITDKRVYTVAIGGILPGANTSNGIGGPAGQYAHDLSNGRLKVSDSVGNARAPKIAPWTSAAATVASFTTSTSTFNAAASVNVTVDGVTEIHIFGSWPQIVPLGSQAVGDYVEFQIAMDGSGIGQANIVRVDSTSGQVFGGGNIHAWLTPAAGTHTLALFIASAGHTYTVSNPYVRVAATLQQ